VLLLNGIYFPTLKLDLNLYFYTSNSGRQLYVHKFIAYYLYLKFIYRKTSDYTITACVGMASLTLMDSQTRLNSRAISSAAGQGLCKEWIKILRPALKTSWYLPWTSRSLLAVIWGIKSSHVVATGTTRRAILVSRDLGAFDYRCEIDRDLLHDRWQIMNTFGISPSATRQSLAWPIVASVWFRMICFRVDPVIPPGSIDRVLCSDLDFWAIGIGRLSGFRAYDRMQ
jgi:hypothetical protein